MNIEKTLAEAIKKAFQTLFQATIEEPPLQPTRKDFEGSHTLVTFPYSKITKKKPEETAQIIGEYLQKETEIVEKFNVVKGFLNLVIGDQVWLSLFREMYKQADYGQLPPNQQKVMVEYSSPNTNKPLHLGHLRNNFLGFALSNILEANGYEVIKSNLVNDRGIHICKSMVAYQRFAKQSTPASEQMKGDHFVGKYYVAFDKALKAESAEIQALLDEKITEEGPEGYPETLSPEAIQELKKLYQKKAAEEDPKKAKDLEARIKKTIQENTSLMLDAKELLQKWESGDQQAVNLWKQMNGWVYEGFDETYEKIGVAFDKIYYESNTYLLGKDIIKEGLKKNIFYAKEDGSVWIDLTADKLDQKLLLRSDGTSVYMTQDLGTADLKYQDYQIDKSVYVVGNEQDYHFKVLFKILEKLGRPYANGLYHVSYGMVDLPTGKMKSREGTVVDADDLTQEMIEIAEARTNQLGKTEGFSKEDLKKLYHTIALGALKYFLLKVDPKKRMLFDPNESVDFQGDAAPFIQYNYARISSILRKAKETGTEAEPDSYSEYKALQATENELIQLIDSYPKKVREAGEHYDPSVIAQYAYELAKAYSSFFAECSIFQAGSEAAKLFRVALSKMTAQVLKKSMNLLGIDVPERM